MCAAIIQYCAPFAAGCTTRKERERNEKEALPPPGRTEPKALLLHWDGMGWDGMGWDGFATLSPNGWEARIEYIR